MGAGFAVVADVDLLRDLRDRVLDESQPLAGLLRTCLALGIAVGSDALRSWASQELKGYETGAELPAYRKLRMPLVADTFSTSPPGLLATQQQISRLLAPAEAQPYIPEWVSILHPIEHVASMAATGQTHQTEVPTLPVATAIWNRVRKARNESPLFVRLYYMLPDTALQGILSVVRTTLVEMVMDLAKDVPLHKLPSQHLADSVVHLHVGGSQDQYHVNVGTNAGVIGQGPGVSQVQDGPPEAS